MRPGDQMAGYRIESILGQGGMGTVYEATQLSLDRIVALKILSPQLGSDLVFRERFRREGHIQAAIDHPHIVTVYEAGEVDDVLFLAMRLVRGSTLKDMIVGRDLEGARTLRLLKPIADALDTAHEAGLTHRDIKPQNILVGVRDHAFLADFGLTKSSTETGLTRTGQFVGTIDYISPEQIRGEAAGAASDIYALTAVLYECLCGVVPYPKPSDAAVLYAHISDPPPLVTDQRPELPPALDEVIARGMAKRPSDRPRSASEMIAEAERAFGKRVRAVITPPGPVEGPEELGIREDESRIPTRESRIRGAPPELQEASADTPLVDSDATVSSRPAEDGAAYAATVDEVDPDRTVAETVDEADPDRTVAETVDEVDPDRTVAETADEVDPDRTVAETTVTGGVDLPVEARSGERAPHRFEASVGHPPKPIKAHRRLIGGALLAFLVLGAVGFSIGRGDREPDASASTAVGSASNADVALDLPKGWRRTERAPAIPGLELTQAMTLAAGPRDDAGLTVGRVERPGDGLLPRSFTMRAEPAPGAQDPVRTEHLQGYRQRALRVRGYSGTLDVLASPTSRATIAFVCFFPSAASAARTECERVVASARLIGAKAGEVGPSSDYARRLNGALKQLNGEARTRRQALAGASTRRSQSQAAAGLGRVYDKAAGDVKAIVPRPLERYAHTSIGASLTRAGEAYRRLASAARSGPITRYDTARRAVSSSERGVRAALDALKGIGYARPAGP